jgi:hypothetical protein
MPTKALRKQQGRTNSMMQKKKTNQAQETQGLSSGFSGREPMTGAQAMHLKTLAEEFHEPAVFQQGLSRREASRRIGALMERLRLGVLPPHTD